MCVSSLVAAAVDFLWGFLSCGNTFVKVSRHFYSPCLKCSLPSCVCVCVCVPVFVWSPRWLSYNNDSGSRVDEQLILTVKREKGRRAELTAASPSHNSSVAHQALSHTYVERRQPWGAQNLQYNIIQDVSVRDRSGFELEKRVWKRLQGGSHSLCRRWLAAR